MRLRLPLTLVALLMAVIAGSAFPSPAAAGLATGVDGWSWQNPNPQGEALKEVRFVDRLHGWTLTRTGTLLATTDGGATWAVQRPVRGAVLGSLAAVDADHAWVEGSPGSGSQDAIFSTGDGGTTWQRHDLTTPAWLDDLVFVNLDRGWGRGYGELYRTTDGGDTWALVASSLPPIMYDYTFVDATHGWVIGADWNDEQLESMVAATSDGGVTWQRRWLDMEIPTAISFADEANGWIVGYGGAILATTDGGVTWSPQATAVAGRTLQDVAFASPTDGWAAGATGAGDSAEALLLSTSDGGTTWTQSGLTAGPRLTAVSVVDDTHVWTVGEAGAMYASDSGGATWNALQAGPMASLNDVAFADASRGCAVGRDGVVLTTTDAGEHWVAGDSGAGTTLFGVSFADAAHGWAVGEGGVILATTDGGVSWTPQVSGTTRTLFKVAFADVARGWAVGRDGVILATTNGGLLWQRQFVGLLSSGGINDVACADGDHAWVVGGGGLIAATSDSGRHWLPQRSRTSEGLRAVEFVDRKIGWATGELGGVLHTSDGGKMWVKQYLPNWEGVLPSIRFANPLHGWIVSESGTVYATSDGGLHWNAQETGLSEERLGRIACSDSAHAWAVGSGGAILATQTGGYSLFPDSVAPTSVAIAPTRWCARPLTVRFVAVDDRGGSGVVHTAYRIAAAATWVSGVTAIVAAPRDHRNDGTHTLKFRSADAAGNVEAVKRCVVRIDTRRPKPRAPYPAGVVHGRVAALRYRVDDPRPGSDSATVKMQIRRLSGDLVRSATISQSRVNVLLTYRFTCGLAAGVYRFAISATDEAGNASTRPAHNTLTVR